jgi:hypothetical protein
MMLLSVIAMQDADTSSGGKSTKMSPTFAGLSPLFERGSLFSFSTPDGK